MSQQFLIASINHGLGHIILNSPRTLNALNQVMAEELLALLAKWESHPEVRCIFLEGAGDKAFCAGGDIKNLYLALKQQTTEAINPTCLKFFITEYTLDYKIHTYPKPIISWNSGITMGGGMGLMNGASHRIVTETSLLAMPEISIGLYPDVGATYFFNKLPAGAGLFLGLTGARINGADAITLGLADFYLKAHAKEELLDRLKAMKEISKIDELLRELSSSEMITPCTQDYLPYFARLKDIKTPQEFIKLTQDFPSSSWLEHCLQTFHQGAPTSAAIIIQQLQLGRPLSLKEALMSELNLSVHCSLRCDFPEGVRALLIDKDQSPQWSPASITELNKELVESYFTPLWSKEDHPFSGWR